MKIPKFDERIKSLKGGDVIFITYGNGIYKAKVINNDPEGGSIYVYIIFSEFFFGLFHYGDNHVLDYYDYYFHHFTVLNPLT